MITIANADADWQTKKVVDDFNSTIKLGKYPDMDFSVSVYVNKETQMSVICTKHNIIFKAKLSELRLGKRTGCKECSLEKTREGKVANHYATSLSETAWQPLEDFIDMRTPIPHVCVGCDSVIDISPINIHKVKCICSPDTEDDWDKTLKRAVAEECKRNGKYREEQTKKRLVKQSKYEFDLFLKENTTVTRISKFKGMIKKCEFVCSVCKRLHERRCNDLKDRVNRTSSNGCKLCNWMNSKGNTDDYYDEPTILYYVKIGKLYKIGITIRSIDERLSREGVDYEILWSKRYRTGKKAFKKEQKILKKHIRYRYYGKPILRHSGNSELFTKDILGLDNEL